MNVVDTSLESWGSVLLIFGGHYYRPPVIADPRPLLTTGQKFLRGKKMTNFQGRNFRGHKRRQGPKIAKITSSDPTLSNGLYIITISHLDRSVWFFEIWSFFQKKFQKYVKIHWILNILINTYQNLGSNHHSEKSSKKTKKKQ